MIGICDIACQQGAPVKAGTQALDVCMNYSGPVTALVGIMTQDFSATDVKDTNFYEVRGHQRIRSFVCVCRASVASGRLIIFMLGGDESHRSGTEWLWLNKKGPLLDEILYGTLRDQKGFVEALREKGCVPQDEESVQVKRALEIIPLIEGDLHLSVALLLFPVCKGKFQRVFQGTTQGEICPHAEPARVEIQRVDYRLKVKIWRVHHAYLYLFYGKGSFLIEVKVAFT